MVNAAIVGATGYGALELIKLLIRHPEARVEALISRDAERPHVASIHPSLAGRIDLSVEPFDADDLAKRVECAFLSLPHQASMAAAAPLLERGVRVSDLSADYRLRDPAVYEEWYGETHADRRNLAHAVYGLPELYRDKIRTAKLIANPGCYPTASILGLAPLLAGKYVDPRTIIIDSKSGVSGAGRTPKLMYHFPECNESVQAYNVGRHRHTPEIEQILSDVAGEPVQVIFTPHLVPMDRGIYSTNYAELVRSATEDELLTRVKEFYAQAPFVRVVEHLPSTKDSVDTNFVDVTVRVVRGRALVLVCEDNLIKGAAGAAVQNFNLMFGFPETLGLL